MCCHAFYSSVVDSLTPFDITRVVHQCLVDDLFEVFKTELTDHECFHCFHGIRLENYNYHDIDNRMNFERVRSSSTLIKFVHKLLKSRWESAMCMDSRDEFMDLSLDGCRNSEYLRCGIIPDVGSTFLDQKNRLVGNVVLISPAFQYVVIGSNIDIHFTTTLHHSL